MTLGVVLAFGLRGLLRGTVEQALGVLGVVSGVAVALWSSQWVGHHWSGARPTALFFLLRWVVAVLAGAGVVALLAALAGWAGPRVREGPLGWLDGATGLAFGGVVGVGVWALLLTIGMFIAWPRGLVDSAARSRTALPVLELAGRASAATRQALPFAPWLEGRFRDARHRIEAADRPR